VAPDGPRSLARPSARTAPSNANGAAAGVAGASAQAGTAVAALPVHSFSSTAKPSSATRPVWPFSVWSAAIVTGRARRSVRSTLSRSTGKTCAGDRSRIARLRSRNYWADPLLELSSISTSTSTERSCSIMLASSAARHCVQAARLTLPIRTGQPLARDQEPGGAGSAARGGRGLGRQTKGAGAPPLLRAYSVSSEEYTHGQPS
jgi:hypothetical protein